MRWYDKLYYVTALILLLSAGFMVGRIIMALLAKFFIFISFDAVYVYAAELFPTVIRYGLIRASYPGRGGDSHMNSINQGFWSHIGVQDETPVFLAAKVSFRAHSKK